MLVFDCLHRAPLPVGRRPESVGEFEVAVAVFYRAFPFRYNLLPQDKSKVY